MDDEQYGSLIAEVRELFTENKTDDLSDAAFVYFIIRTALKDRKILTFLMANNWKEFALNFNSVVMGYRPPKK